MSEVKFVSEMIEPCVAYMIEVSRLKLFDAQTDYLKFHNTDEIYWYKLANEMCRHWCLMKTIGELSASMCGEPVHFSLSMSNELRREAKLLLAVGGVCPITEKEKFHTRQFDFSNLVLKTKTA